MDLAVKIAGIEFKNPIIAASGYPTYHPKLMKKCVEAGVAGVTMKTTSVVEQNWMKQTLAPLFYDKWGGETGTISCQYGFIQPDTAAKYLKEMKPITKKEDVVLIASIEATASDLEGWGNLAKKCEDAGADMIENMLCCPIGFEVDTGVAAARLEENLTKITRAVKDAVSIPVITKIGFEHDHFIRKTAPAVEKGGADAIHAHGFTTATTVINVETAEPVESGTYCSWSRGMTRGTSLHAADAISKLVKIPVISSGGMYTWRDAVERIMVGALGIAVHTAIFHKGYKVIQPMIDGIKDFMERKSYSKIEDMLGIASPHMMNFGEFMGYLGRRLVDPEKKQYTAPKEDVIVRVNADDCNGCRICVECLWGAVTMKDEKAVIDLEECERCGRCWSLCPTDAIVAKIPKTGAGYEKGVFT